MWQAVLDMMNRKDHLKEEGIEVNLKIRELQHQSLGPNGHRYVSAISARKSRVITLLYAGNPSEPQVPNFTKRR
jgi:hypothetical protein